MAAPGRSVIFTSGLLELLELTSLVARQRPGTALKIAAMTSYPRSTVPSTRVRAERQLLSPSAHPTSPKRWYRTQSFANTSASGTGTTAITAANAAELHLRWEERSAYSPDLLRLVALHADSATATAATQKGIEPKSRARHR